MGGANEKDGKELTPRSADERVVVAEVLPGNGANVAPGSPAVMVTMCAVSVEDLLQMCQLNSPLQVKFQR